MRVPDHTSFRDGYPQGEKGNPAQDLLETKLSHTGDLSVGAIVWIFGFLLLQRL